MIMIIITIMIMNVEYMQMQMEIMVSSAVTYIFYWLLKDSVCPALQI